MEKTYEAILNEGAAPGLPARTALAMQVLGSGLRLGFGLGLCDRGEI